MVECVYAVRIQPFPHLFSFKSRIESDMNEFLNIFISSFASFFFSANISYFLNVFYFYLFTQIVFYMLRLYTFDYCAKKIGKYLQNFERRQKRTKSNYTIDDKLWKFKFILSKIPSSRQTLARQFVHVCSSDMFLFSVHLYDWVLPKCF